MYDPLAPSGSRWSNQGLPTSTVNRMYHSGATLLPDGSVFVAGSNPNPDYTVGPTVTYPWEDRTEIFFPWYYDQHRPEPQGLPANLTYGGSYFNVSLTLNDLDNTASNINNTNAIVIRTGYSTHAFNMGQRVLKLRTSYTVANDGSAATLHVSQMPNNPNIFAPGPALLFITVNGVPSIGQWVTVGSGSIGAQPTQNDAVLPQSYIPSGLGGNSTHGNAAMPVVGVSKGLVSAIALALSAAVLGASLL
jgi:hypothetical protein